MSMEWRNGQLLDDEELERIWKLTKARRKPQVIKYDVAICWLLAGLFCGAVWASGYWLFLQIAAMLRWPL
jgi:hypothetical protein